MVRRSAGPGVAPLPATTAARGLGYAHQVAVAELKRAHVDGTPCDWCGRPMYLDRTRNWDYNPQSSDRTSGVLHGDHSGIARSRALRTGTPVPLPDRLLHGRCNVQRGDGSNDHLAWCNRQNCCTTTQSTASHAS
nr:hypothetical protein [Mycobacteroides abscessus]